MTLDGGKTWHFVPAPCGGRGWSQRIEFVDDLHGWIANGPMIFSTSDGGATWGCQVESLGEWAMDLSFVDAAHGWAVTLTGDVYQYGE